MTSTRRYLPAAGRDWLLWTCDPWVTLLGASAIRSALLDQMVLEPGQRVLDVGCGTGSLVVRLAQRHVGISVVGLDADPAALALAQRKAQRAGVDVHLDRGFSDQLPYADASFDCVSCTLMFSLLPTAVQETTLREILRVLRVGCSFHLLDLVKMPPGGCLVRLLRSGQGFQVCTEEQIVVLAQRAGFSDVRKTGQYSMWFWPLASYQAWHS